MRRRGTKTTTAIAVWALAMTWVTAAGAMDHSHHMQMQHEKSAMAPSKVSIALPDTVLTDQDGHKQKFKSEAIADRLVAINFIYTSCTTVCPVQSAIFADVQKRLGDRVGKDVVMISVTVDPVRDTPPVLKRFASSYHAGPGWRFLTGSAQKVEEVLKAFDVYIANFDDHPATIVVGDPRSGEWVRYFGFPASTQIVNRLDRLQAARAGAHSARAEQRD